MKHFTAWMLLSALSSIHLAQAAFTLITLPYEVFYSLDAIIRTIWRMLISHKRLLEWNPSNVIGNNNRITLLSSYRRMWISPIISIITIIYFEYSRLVLPAVAIPILFLWALSPTITWWLSLPV